MCVVVVVGACILVCLLFAVDQIFGREIGQSVWGIFFIVGVFGLPILGMIRYAMPRKGVVHAPRNRIMGFAVITVLGIILGIGGIIFSGAFLIPNVTPETGGLAVFLYLVGFMIALLWFLIGGITSRGVGSVGKKHPAVVQSIRRYQKRGEFLGKNFPRLIVDGKTYYSVVYWAYEGLNSTKETGVLIFNDQGRIVADEELTKKIAKCHYLATLTIDESYGVNRSNKAESASQSIKTIKNMGVVLKEQTPYFEALGADVEQARQRVQSSADVLQEWFEGNTQSDTLEAEWGRARGFHRMAECRYEDLLELETRMKAVMQPCLDKKGSLIDGGKAAEKLIYTIKQHGSSIHSGDKYYFLNRKRNIMEFLDILKMAGDEVSTVPDRYERLGFSDLEWQLWRNRMEYAQAVDKGSAK
jgi:hypothetical protein